MSPSLLSMWYIKTGCLTNFVAWVNLDANLCWGLLIAATRTYICEHPEIQALVSMLTEEALYLPSFISSPTHPQTSISSYVMSDSYFSFYT